MSHLGYFSWSCEHCGHRCKGDLPGGAPLDPLRRAAASG
jgi:hypothetical protein